MPPKPMNHLIWLGIITWIAFLEGAHRELAECLSPWTLSAAERLVTQESTMEIIRSSMRQSFQQMNLKGRRIPALET